MSRTNVDAPPAPPAEEVNGEDLPIRPAGSVQWRPVRKSGEPT